MKLSNIDPKIWFLEKGPEKCLYHILCMAFQKKKKKKKGSCYALLTDQI